MANKIKFQKMPKRGKYHYRLLEDAKVQIPKPKKRKCWDCGGKVYGYRDECLNCFRERQGLPR